MTTPPPGDYPQYPNAPQYPGAGQYPTGGQYATGGQYPGGAYPGAPVVVAREKPATPGSVWIAWLIYLLAAVVGVVGAVLVFNSDVYKDALNDAIANSDTVTQSTINSIKTIAIAIGIIFAALFVFFDFMMRAGRNWSRIVLTVLSALSIISAFSTSRSVTVGDHTYNSSGTSIVSIISGVIAVIAIVLMFLPASNLYFKASLAFRKGTYR